MYGSDGTRWGYIGGASFAAQFDGGNVKIGSAASDMRKLYFGDGTFVYVGENGADDRLTLYGGSMAISIGGSVGAAGNVLTSNGTTASWAAPGGGSSLWTDQGSYYYANNNSYCRVDDDQNLTSQANYWVWAPSTTGIIFGPDDSGYGWCGTTDDHFYGVAADYLRYDENSQLFDTYDDLALLNAIEADTVWDPVLKHHKLWVNEETLPLCVTNYRERAANPNVPIMSDVGSWIGLLTGTARQLDRETDLRDKRLAARDDILAKAVGLDFGNADKDAIKINVSDFGTSKMQGSDIWVSFSTQFSTQLDNSIPIVTVTPNSPNVVLYITEKTTKGFKVIGVSGNDEFSFDWIAMAKVEVKIEKSDNDIDHIDDIFYVEKKEIPKNAYPVAMPTPTLTKDIKGNVTALPYEYELDMPAGAPIYEPSLPDLSKVKGLYETEEGKDTKPSQPWYDANGSQIPPEWVEELRQAGTEMFTYEQMMERRKQNYIDNAKAKKEREENTLQEQENLLKEKQNEQEPVIQENKPEELNNLPDEREIINTDVKKAQGRKKGKSMPPVIAPE